MNLNEFQKEAVEHVDGPCLVTSCPGSGKTFTLVERIVNLISRGVPSRNILCITFTNKAANEMRERICRRLGKEKPGFFIGTFHSLCANLIRRIGPGRGYSSRFTILDERDQADMVMQVARHMEHEIKQGDARRIAHALNFQRDQMEDFDWVEETLRTPCMVDIAEEYIKRCRNNNLLDFSGLIYETIRIIEEHEDVREKVQETFKYILVDESQDTNKSQFYLVNLLGAKWKNIMLIGDIDQCIIEGEKVLTNDGWKKIEDIKKEEGVISASGGGNVTSAIVVDKYKKKVFNRPIVRLKTKLGFNMTMTKEHMIFAEYNKLSPKKIIVYLMYDREFGYRIGVTNTKRKHGINGQGLGARLQQERAEYLWILKSVDDIDNAKYWEQYFSVKYGIPTWCFYSGKKQRNLDYSDKNIRRLFSSINTNANAKKLMNDLWLFKERPHYIPKCMGKNKRRNFTINMCADSRCGTLHRYAISGSDDTDGEKLKKAGLNVRGLCEGRRGWRVESAWKSIGKIYDILETVKESLGEVNVIEKARFCDETLSLMPASHLKEGMAIYVGDKDGITIDYVESIEFDYYYGNIYDINVEDYHNFITNGVVSHNSIYGWRGARYQNVQEFLETYDNCKLISLSKNYRSTPQIIAIADKLIKLNTSHMKTKFETDNPHGEPVKCYSFGDQLKEAAWVGQMARKLVDEGGWDPSDIAVLYRVNKMSEPIEQAMVNNGIPYDVIGAWNFYDRKEARDCLAMLKVIHNSKDGIAFHRIMSMLPGVGDVSIGRIEKIAADQNISMVDACKIMKNQSSSVAVKNGCDKMVSIFGKKWDVTKPASCLQRVVDSLGYRDHIYKKFSGKADERLDNVDQMRDACGEFEGQEDGLNMFLQRVSLVTSADKESKDNKASLMSLHAAKGLEFPIVFIIGLEEGILPHQQAVRDDPVEGMEEERRLCYVGLTRAKKLLYTSWCRNRRVFGGFGGMKLKRARPSSFLYECGLMRKD